MYKHGTATLDRKRSDNTIVINKKMVNISFIYKRQKIMVMYRMSSKQKFEMSDDYCYPLDFPSSESFMRH